MSSSDDDDADDRVSKVPAPESPSDDEAVEMDKMESGSGWKKGDLGEALWEDGHYYNVTVTDVKSGNKVAVTYEGFNENAIISTAHLRKRDPKSPNKSSAPKKAAAASAAAGGAASGAGCCAGAGAVGGLSIPVIAAIAAAVATIIILSVVLTLPETVSCHAEDEKYFVVKVPVPNIAMVEPSMICNYYNYSDLEIKGSGFLIYNDETSTHSHFYNMSKWEQNLAYARASLSPPVRGESCEAVDVRKQDVSLCSNYFVRVPQLNKTTEFRAGSDATGRAHFYPDLRVVSPHPEDPHATASTSEEACMSHVSNLLAIVPPPAVFNIFPPTICDDVTVHTLSLTGEYFIQHQKNSSDPKSLQVPASGTSNGQSSDFGSLTGCQKFNVSGYSMAEHCTTMNVKVTTAICAPGLNTLLTTNPAPAACKSRADFNFHRVKRPAMLRTEPPAVCLFDAAATIKIFGASNAEFLTVKGPLANSVKTFPKVTVDGVDGAVTQDGTVCTPLTGVANHDLAMCGQVDVVIPQVATTPSMYFAELKMQPPTGAITGQNSGLDPTHMPVCEMPLTAGLLVVPPPTLASLSPTAFCSNTPITIMVNGTNFMLVEETTGGAILKPSVHIRNTNNPSVDILVNPSFVTVDLTSCTALTGNAEFTKVFKVQHCTKLEVKFPLSFNSQFAEGFNQLGLRNPPPANCVTVNTLPFEVVPAPEAITTPSAFCAAKTDKRIDITGRGLLKFGGADPSLLVNSVAVTPASLIQYLGPIDVSANYSAPPTTQYTSLATNFDKPQGVYQLSVRQAFHNGLQCTSTPSALSTVTIKSPAESLPTIISVTPSFYCFDVDTTLTVVADKNLARGMEVYLQQGKTVSQKAAAVRVPTAAKLEADFKKRLSTPGVYDLVIADILGGCGNATRPLAVTVQPTPVVFFIDPSIMYANISVLATLYTSGLVSEAKTITVSGPGAFSKVYTNSKTALPGTPLGSLFTSVPGNVNRIRLVIPAFLASGDYSITVESEFGCVGNVGNAFKVTSLVTVDIASVNPSIMWNQISNAIDVKGSLTLPAGKVRFENSPRIYLNPQQVGNLATVLKSVIFDSPSLLLGVVSAGLPVGLYDVILVNPSGSIGVVKGAIKMVPKELPRVVAASPTALIAADLLTLVGTNFELGNITAALACKSSPANLQQITIPPTMYPLTVQSHTSEQQIIFNAPTLAPATGAVCVVVLTRTSDQAQSRFSSISYRSGSGNFPNNFFPYTERFIETRSDVAVTAGRVTTKQKYFYVMGGDSGNGVVTTAKSSVEYSQYDEFGNLQPFQYLQRTPLLSNLTGAASVTIGQYVYLVGGYNRDSGTSVGTVQRAQVLNPSDSPVLDASVSVDLITKTFFTPGSYTWRVAALFPKSFLHNPDGETLAGESLTVNIPNITDVYFTVTLTWPAVPNASGYRLYRAYNNTFKLLFETLTPILSFADVGSPPTAKPATAGLPFSRSFDTPMPAGSLGNWHTVVTLPGGGRMYHALTTLVDPADSQKVRLYAIGGQSAVNVASAIDSIEYAVVTMIPSTGLYVPETHSLTTFAPTTFTFLGGFTRGSARGVDRTNFVPTMTKQYIITSSSQPATGGPSPNGYMLEVTAASGDVSNVQVPDYNTKNQGNPARAGVCFFTGAGDVYNMAGATSVAGTASTSGASTTLKLVNNVWSIGNFNNLANVLTKPVKFATCVQEQSLLYIFGGTDNNQQATGEIVVNSQ